jgi:hypothetical protein
MINSPLKSYGFVYEFEQCDYSFQIIAQSEKEALGKFQEMKNASLIGDLKSEVLVGE